MNIDRKANHIMVDIETLNTEMNSVILSIGAVKFNLDGEIGDKFNINVDIQNCLDNGLEVKGSTIEWWLGQSKEAQEAFLLKKRSDLVFALCNFSQFVDKDSYIWGNSARFDLGILQNAFNKTKINIPWDFRKELDVRTIAWLNPEIVNKVKEEFKGIKHDPVQDCLLQIKYVVEILKK